jgi:lantibiotic transport system permease protein
MSTYHLAFQSEWLKKKRSAASWLTVAGALLVPAIVIMARLIDSGGLADENKSEHLWEALYNRSWQFMGFFLLPMGIVLATNLIVQIEYRSNAWKQLGSAPVSFTTVWLAKLSVVLLLLLEFFLLFNLGIFLEGVLPALSRGVPYPGERFPVAAFLRGNARFLLDCLPIVLLQYLLCVQFRNFMIPLGVGLGLYVVAMAAAHWRYGYIIPYTYPVLECIGVRSPSRGADFHIWSAGWSLVFGIAGYILYITKKNRG